MDTEKGIKKSRTRSGRVSAARSGRGARFERHLRLRHDTEQPRLLGRHARLPDQGTGRDSSTSKRRNVDPYARLVQPRRSISKWTLRAVTTGW